MSRHNLSDDIYATFEGDTVLLQRFDGSGFLMSEIELDPVRLAKFLELIQKNIVIRSDNANNGGTLANS